MISRLENLVLKLILDSELKKDVCLPDLDNNLLDFSING
jgi:hypothetical protein